MRDPLVVTGANGFVGRHLVVAAVAAGRRVRGFVRSERGARLVAEAGGEARILERWSADTLAGALEGAVAVVHLANVGAERGGATYEQVNVRGTETVVEASRRAGVRRSPT